MDCHELDLDVVRAAARLSAAAVPDRAGLYAWCRDGEVLFVGAAWRLRGRILRELNRPRRRAGQLSPLRERVALHLVRDMDQPIPWRGPKRRKAVDAWLRTCQVGWRSMPRREADAIVDDLLAGELPLLHRWRPRPREDVWLTQYLAARERGGRVYAEVPIGGGPGSRERRIDAVWLPTDGPMQIRYHHGRLFERERPGASLEVIEVKEALGRFVVGQLIVAGDLINRQWGDVGPVELVAVVTRDDALIRQLCEDVYGIRVEVVQPSY